VVWPQLLGKGNSFTTPLGLMRPMRLPNTSGAVSRFPLDDLPVPWNWLYFALHALAYTAILFLAGIFGERPKSAKEVVLATQRALEQQALERWRMQKEAQIEAMMREGAPLGAVAAALASPETAERIALMEAATGGQLSALDAARLNLQRAGHDVSLLDGLRSSSEGGERRTDRNASPAAGGAEGGAVETAEALLRPLGLASRSPRNS